MADNAKIYGIRYHHTIGGGPRPTPERHIVSTAQSFDVSGGAANCALRAGDLVRMNAAGGMEQADGTEATAEAAYGVVVSVGPYWDGAVMRPTKELPSDIAWGTLLERQSTVYVVPLNGVVWEIDVDDATTATTEAAYQALIGSNMDHILTGATGESYLDPQMDISTTNTTNTLLWRMVGISPTRENQDFSGANVKILVRANVSQQPEHGGITGL